MKKILATLIAVGCVAAIAMFAMNAQDNSISFFKNGVTDEEKEFINFIGKFHKSYLSKSEYQKRFGAFKSNLDIIKNHKGDVTLTVTQFTDLTFEEFSATYLGFKAAKPERVNYILGTESMPSKVDWVAKGAVTDVKDQGQCGSCWAFSTTGSVEGAYFLKNGQLKSFSEQDLVDCSTSYGNNGCNGGLMDYGFQYLEAKGDELESDYPYTARDGSCSRSSSKTAVTVTGYTDVPAGDEGQLKAAVVNQPISVAVAANSAWQMYGGGIMSYSDCPAGQLDHGVLLVGYNDADGSLKVKNSWASSWGEAGYIRLEAGKNTCGIANSASYPSV